MRPALRSVLAAGLALSAVGCDRAAPASEPPVSISVLFVTTPEAAAAAGGPAPMRAAIGEALDASNEALHASGVNVRFVLAAQVERPVVLTDRRSDLRALIDPGDGILDDVHALRDAALADVVVLVPERPGHTINGAILATPETAFVIVHREDLGLPKHGLAHEIAHLMGARHDFESDPSRVPFADGHGYRDAEVRTIMSGGGTLERLGVFSSPLVRRAGRIVGDDSLRNVARVLRETAAYVASFRGPAIATTFRPPGTWPTVPNVSPTEPLRPTASACDAYGVH